MYYKDITLTGLQAAIGYEDENLPTRVIIDISDLTKYGTGTTVLEVKRPCDGEAYIAEQTEVDGNNFYWYPTKGDLEVSGLLKCQVKAVIGDQIVKTRVYYVRVIGALNGDGTLSGVVPDALQTFVESASGSEDAAKASAEEAKASETAAAKSASDADASASAAADSAKQSYDQATASAESATASATSAGESEQSKTQAQEYAQNAYNSAVGAESAKDDAEDARDEIRSMRAEAVTLSPGSDATASYSDGLLSLGIPRGDKGETGATGATGPKGDKGDPGEVTQAEFDALADEVAPVIKNSASGAIASFPDGAARPVDDLTVQIEPVQDLHGYDSPWPAGSGKNLLDWDKVSVSGTHYGMTFSKGTAEGTVVISGTLTTTDGAVASISYADNSLSGKGYVFLTEHISGDSVIELNRTYGFRTENEKAIAVFLSGNVGQSYTETIRVSVYAASQTSWTPYENICPISGWTGAKVTRTGKNLLDMSDITDYSKWSADIAPSGSMPSNFNNKIYSLPALKSGVQYTISFGVTSESFPTYLYFGYYKDNSANRIAYVTKNLVSNQSISFTAIAGVTYCLRMGSTHIEDAFKDQIAKVSYIQLELGSTATDYEPYQSDTYDIAFPTEAGTVYGGSLDVTTGVLTVDRAQIASYAGETLPSTWISDRDVYSAGATPTTGAQVVYELVTPITYHLTPQEITTLLGQNNMWADTGDTSVTYKADTKRYIDKKFTELQALILEN